jgi:hypothetical protein
MITRILRVVAEFFLVVLGFWTQGLALLGNHFTIWTIPPALFASVILFLWCWGLNPGPVAWATPPSLLCDWSFFETGSHELFAWAGFKPWASWVARSTGKSHLLLPALVIFKIGSHVYLWAGLDLYLPIHTSHIAGWQVLSTHPAFYWLRCGLSTFCLDWPPTMILPSVPPT